MKLTPDLSVVNALADLVAGGVRAARRGYATGVEARARREREVERVDLKKRNAGLHGTSRWSSVAELRESDLLGRADEVGQIAPRIPLGPLAVWNERTEPQEAPHPQHFAFWNGNRPGHFITIGGARGGKETSQIVPTLLHYPGSAIVVDARGTTYEKTAGWRHLQGSKIIRIAPFDKQGHTDAFNPIDHIRDDGDARRLANILLPFTQGSAEAKFFHDEAVNFLTGVILFVARHTQDPRRRNLSEVRRYTAIQERAEILKLVGWMAGRRNATISTAGRLALERANAGGRRDLLIELFRSLDADMAMWDHPGMQRATARSDVNLADLKRESITVYLTMPFEMMKDFGALLRIFFTQAADAMSEGELDVPVLFLIDEFPAMGPMPAIVDNLAFLYGRGARVWLFAQNQAQIEATYRDNWRPIIETANLKLYLNVKPPGTKMISEELGKQNIAYDTINENEGTNRSEGKDSDTRGSNEGAARSTHFMGRPLLMPDEVERWLSRKRKDLPHLGLLTLVMADDRRFCVNRPYFRLSEPMRDMIARGEAHLARIGPEKLKDVYKTV